MTKHYSKTTKNLLAIIAIAGFLINAVPASGQWTQTKGPGGGMATVLMADTSGNFIAGTTGGGIFTSADSGQTWMQSNTGITQHSFTVNYLDTMGMSTFMVGTSNYQSYLYQSMDNGHTWTANTNNITAYTVVGMGHVGSRMFIGTSKAVLYSDNMDTTWAALNLTSFLDTNTQTIYSLNIADTVLFASVSDSGLYKSSDKGMTWLHVGTGLNPLLPVTKIVTTFPTLWASFSGNSELMMSADGGMTWTLTNIIGNNYNINDIYGLNGNLFVMTGSAIYLTSDTGMTFTTFSNFVAPYTHLIFSGFTFISSTTSFLQISNDFGSTWNETFMGFSNSTVTAVYSDSTGIYASTLARDLYTSADSGMTYTNLQTVIGGTFYANDIVKVDSNIIQGGNNSQVFSSNNSGFSWTDLSIGMPAATTINQFLLNGADLYAATSSGILKNNSMGSWFDTGNGITAGTSFNSVAMSGTRLFIAGQDATLNAVLFYSDDNGGTWTNAALNLGPYTSADKLFVSGNTILLSAAFNLYASTDNGMTWTQTGTGLPTAKVNAFFMDGITIYAGIGQGESPDGDFLSSNDNGANWTSMRDNLYNSNVTSITKSGNNLYVGTYDGGVWKRSVSTVTAVQHPKPLAAVFSVYPNPAKEHITVTTTAGGKLTIRNITGQLVYSNTIYKGIEQINTKDFPNGIYTIQLIDGNKVKTEKLIINN